MTDLHTEAALGSRSAQLDRVIRGLLAQTPEIEAAAVVSFDGLPMAAALPASMDEDRVAAMSAALLSLGERAAEGLGRGELSQVYIEGDNGTVFLVSADDEAVLVAVASKGAKAGMMMYEVRRAAAVVATVLRAEEASEHPAAVEPAPAPHLAPPTPPSAHIPAQPASAVTYQPASQPAPEQAAYAPPTYAPPTYDTRAPVDPLHDVPLYDLPVYDAPRDEIPSHVVPQYEIPQYELAQFAVPQYEPPLPSAPLHPAPQHPEAQYREPSHSEPAYGEPTYSEPTYSDSTYGAPAYTEPAPVPAAEPVWPLHAPTGSVMPGGGVPPSTWS